MQARDRQAAGQADVFFQRRKVRRHQELCARLRQRPVSRFIRIAPCGRQVQPQRRLIQLHPLGACRAQLRQQFAVHRQQRIEQRQAREGVRRAALLAQPEESERTQQRHLHAMAQGARLGDFVQQPRR
jgi:hypothetical protein